MTVDLDSMPRKPASFRIDERVLDVIATLAARSGVEPQRYLENYFFAKGKELELIPPEAEPLGETRGGSRQGAGKKPKTSQQDSTDNNSTDRDDDVEKSRD